MPLPYDADAAIVHLGRCDRRLGRLIERVGEFSLQIKSRQTPFQSLAKAIVYQQLAGRAAQKIHARLVDQLPRRAAEQPAALLDLKPAQWRAIGVSRAKTAALRDLAEKTLDGTVPASRALRRMPDDEIVERITAVRGIGPWTVEMLLIFGLGRPDVLPATDFGIRKGFALTYSRQSDTLPAPRAIIEHGQRWQPYRSVASWYLWRAVDLANDR